MAVAGPSRPFFIAIGSMVSLNNSKVSEINDPCITPQHIVDAGSRPNLRSLQLIKAQHNFKNIVFSNIIRANPFSGDLPLLHFRKKYDICTLN